MKKEILRILKETKGYLSGQELCEKFSVSRTAVWKAIGQLREEGYEIESASNRGYRLVGVPDRVTELELGSYLAGCPLGQNIVYREEVDSTNTEAKRQAEAGAAHGTVVLAERQTQGKGRRGKSWGSPEGTGIWLSLLLRSSIAPDKASCLTLVAALAVSRAVEKVTGLKAEIKWPNDLVLNGKKICGILTEMSSELDFIHYVVTGIGINVNMADFPEELPHATSLRIESGKEYLRAELAACVIWEFSACYEDFLERESLEKLLSDYNGRLVNKGRQVQVLKEGRSIQGTALGVNAQGELLIEAGGKTEAILSGEVSVRGIYGYV